MLFHYNNDVMPRFLNEYGNYIRLCFKRNLEKKIYLSLRIQCVITRFFPEKMYLLSVHFYNYFKFVTSSDNFVNMAVFRGDPCGIICLVITYMSLFYADYVVVRHLIIPSMSNT